MSSRGLANRSLAELLRVLPQLPTGLERRFDRLPPYSGSVPPRMTFVWSKMNFSSSSGMPIIWQMMSSGSRAATSSTKSIFPFDSTSSMMRAARVVTYSSSWFTIRGVNPRFTISRSFVCRGASMLIIEPKSSLTSCGRSGMLDPLPEMNSFGIRLAKITSSYFTSDQ